MNAILMNNGMMGGMPNLGYDMGQPVLANGPMNPAQPGGALSGNARGSIRMPQMPQNQRINMGGEGLMRIGGNMIGASANGGLAALNAGTNTYGDIMDYNRARDMDEFAIQEAQALEQQRRLDLQRKLEQEQTPEADEDAVGEVRSAIAKLQAAKDLFTEDKDSSLTGYNWKAIASRLTGRTVGNEDEAKRLFLQEIRLDSVMQRVAQTKGAISNAEMQLFASQAPTLDSNDVVWKAWLDRQLLLQQKILGRLQTGQTVAPDAPLDQDLLATSNTTSISDPEVDALVNQYAPDTTE